MATNAAELLGFTLYEAPASRWQVAQLLFPPCVAPPAPAGNPTVTNFSPSPGTVISPTQPLSFYVTDTDGLALQVLLVVFTYPNGVRELAYDGVSLSGLYANSVVQQLAVNMWNFSFVRVGGWQGTPTLNVFAIDSAGKGNS